LLLPLLVPLRPLLLLIPAVDTLNIFYSTTVVSVRKKAAIAATIAMATAATHQVTAAVL
jgi:hypothetical protein